MENQLFRKKTMETISSPESLHDYMRVTSPQLWMILGAIVVLLAGFIVFASTANMESTMSIQVNVEQFETTDDEGNMRLRTFLSGSLPREQKNLVSYGKIVRIGALEGTIGLVFEDTEEVGFSVEMGEESSTKLQEGVYDAVLVLESTTPISFLWN